MDTTSLDDDFAPGDTSASAEALIGRSEAVQRLRKAVRIVGPRSAAVLIEGEFGSGREYLARQIHAHSPRHHHKFIAIDCAAYRDSVLETRLFGELKDRDKPGAAPTPGLVAAAEGGTLYLDELPDASLQVQARLLRAVREQISRPVGSRHKMRINVRFIVSTHRDLRQMVNDGAFRQDLHDRLRLVRLRIPPLRERPEDIAPLAQHLLARFCRQYQQPPRTLDPLALSALESYRWPGNVRELENALEHAFILTTRTTLTLDDLPQVVRQWAADRAADCAAAGGPVEANDAGDANAPGQRSRQAVDADRALTDRLLDLEHHRTARTASGNSIRETDPSGRQ